ncbi:cyclic GMP-AMP synthase-like receptor 2 isoform X2 [Drosophila kikkawai]|uniref:Cyclic GMP-AMP synthase-like receptor 2 isoform X2 n=1 Tax=Drosophila kikkawai TaxID=30033 RepID=A0ABM4GB04_DROKI
MSPAEQPHCGTKFGRQEQPHYWLQPLTVILSDMFEELTECLLQGWLPFYWDPELNMLDLLTRDQVTEMYRCVKSFSAMLGGEVGYDSPRRTGGSPLVVLRAFSHKEERTPLRASQRLAKRKDIKRLQLR